MQKKLTNQDFRDVAEENNLTTAHIKAVVEVESLGDGFNKLGKPIILFEGHKFHKYTEGKFSNDPRYKDISYPRWTKKWYTGTQEGEYDRLQRAVALDLEAALKSTSWGLFQIMGFNYEKVGYENVAEFVAAMGSDEREQLDAFIRFIKNTKRKGKTLLEYLKNEDWESFAKFYNGPAYKKNDYHNKLKKAYEKHS